MNSSNRRKSTKSIKSTKSTKSTTGTEITKEKNSVKEVVANSATNISKKIIENGNMAWILTYHEDARPKKITIHETQDGAIFEAIRLTEGAIFQDKDGILWYHQRPYDNARTKLETLLDRIRKTGHLNYHSNVNDVTDPTECEDIFYTIYESKLLTEKPLAPIITHQDRCTSCQDGINVHIEVEDYLYYVCSDCSFICPDCPSEKNNQRIPKKIGIECQFCAKFHCLVHNLQHRTECRRMHNLNLTGCYNRQGNFCLDLYHNIVLIGNDYKDVMAIGSGPANTGQIGLLTQKQIEKCRILNISIDDRWRMAGPAAPKSIHLYDYLEIYPTPNNVICSVCHQENNNNCIQPRKNSIFCSGCQKYCCYRHYSEYEKSCLKCAKQKEESIINQLTITIPDTNLKSPIEFYSMTNGHSWSTGGILYRDAHGLIFVNSQPIVVIGYDQKNDNWIQPLTFTLIRDCQKLGISVYQDWRDSPGRYGSYMSVHLNTYLELHHSKVSEYIASQSDGLEINVEYYPNKNNPDSQLVRDCQSGIIFDISNQDSNPIAIGWDPESIGIIRTLTKEKRQTLNNLSATIKENWAKDVSKDLISPEDYIQKYLNKDG